MYLYNYFQFPHYKNIYVNIKKEEEKKKITREHNTPLLLNYFIHLIQRDHLSHFCLIPFLRSHNTHTVRPTVLLCLRRQDSIH